MRSERPTKPGYYWCESPPGYLFPVQVIRCPPGRIGGDFLALVFRSNVEQRVDDMPRDIWRGECLPPEPRVVQGEMIS